jgi:hypothetical protein
MSKKYVPTFLKGMDQDKPLVNTSLPAKQAPTFVPATLAAITSNNQNAPVICGSSNGIGAGGGGGSKQSYAAKFSNKVKAESDPNYVAPPKPIDLTSEDDFPSLGAPKSKPANTVLQKPVVTPVATAATGSFADLAKGWARQKEEQAEAERRKAQRAEQKRREAEQLRRTMPNVALRRRRGMFEDDEEEEEDYQPNYDQSSLGESDSYEMPEEDEEPLADEEEDEENEFNQNLGWDGRRKNDLY